MGAYIVLRVKGLADVPHWASTTLRLLKLDKKYRATIVPKRDNTLGMLKKVQHYVAWRELDADLARVLLDRRARKSGYRKISDDDLASLNFQSTAELADSLASGNTTMSKLRPLKPWFALAPPRGGFKRSTKRLYGQKGVLGHNRDLDALIRRMI